MKTIRLCLLCLGLALLAAPARADWPMSGHDPQRTSCAPEDVFAVTEKPLWHKRIDGYIPRPLTSSPFGAEERRETWFTCPVPTASMRCIHAIVTAMDAET